MDKPVIVMGMGEMGGVFARGFLRLGRPVYPALRQTRLADLAATVPDPELVLVATGEADLEQALGGLPQVWRDRTALLQNELLPQDWQRQGLLQPTVISVWFEKKHGREPKQIIPSPVFGPHADLIAQALGTINIQTRVLDDSQALLRELVLKNLYILTTNIAGLIAGGTVSNLWLRHESLARQVAGEVLVLQEYLTGATFDTDALIDDMLVAFRGDPEHQCMGRSAPARLQRALNLAKQAGLEVPTLRDIAARAN